MSESERDKIQDREENLQSKDISQDNLSDTLLALDKRAKK